MAISDLFPRKSFHFCLFIEQRLPDSHLFCLASNFKLIFLLFSCLPASPLEQLNFCTSLGSSVFTQFHQFTKASFTSAVHKNLIFPVTFTHQLITHPSSPPPRPWDNPCIIFIFKKTLSAALPTLPGKVIPSQINIPVM